MRRLSEGCCRRSHLQIGEKAVQRLDASVGETQQCSGVVDPQPCSGAGRLLSLLAYPDGDSAPYIASNNRAAEDAPGRPLACGEDTGFAAAPDNSASATVHGSSLTRLSDLIQPRRQILLAEDFGQSGR